MSEVRTTGVKRGSSSSSSVSVSVSAGIGSRRVCRVGYAMNAKKLRKSHKDTRTDAHMAVPVSGSPSPPPPPHSSVFRPWRGGGLADILVSQPSDTEAEDDFDTQRDRDQDREADNDSDQHIHPERLRLPQREIEMFRETQRLAERQTVRFYPFTFAASSTSSTSSTSTSTCVSCSLNAEEVAIERNVEHREEEVEVEDFQQIRDFQILIHKLTDDIERGDPQGRLNTIQKFLSKHRDTVLVDPIDAVRIVTSRLRTCDELSRILNRLTDHTRPFQIPRYVVVSSTMSQQDVLAVMTEAQLSFPVICKPIEACGTPQSHSMVVLVSEDDLHMMTKPCIVQKYHDHNGSLFKVYVIDRDVMVYRRASLPDLGITADSVRSVAFDSRFSYPTLRDFANETSISSAPVQPNCSATEENGSWKVLESPQKVSPGLSTSQAISRVEGANVALYSFAASEKSKLDVDKMLSKSDQLGRLFFESAMKIRDEFGLTLFGFDVITPAPFQFCGESTPSSPIMVIDVNYFPSYKEVVDFPQRLKKYLWRLAFNVSS